MDIPGHHYSQASGVFLDAWGDGPFIVKWKGRRWAFEFSAMFGPSLLRWSDFEISDQQPVSKNHPFWEAFEAWQRAGAAQKRMRKARVRRTTVYVCQV